jgi:hypothetical protein
MSESKSIHLPMDKTFYQHRTPGQYGLSEHFPDSAGFDAVVREELLVTAPVTLQVDSRVVFQDCR